MTRFGSSPRTLVSLFLFLLLGPMGCTPTGNAPPETPDDTVRNRPAVEAGQTYLTAFDAEIDELLEQMTLEEKVGQMTQADMSFIEDPEDVAHYFLGSVLSGGNSDPEAGNSPEAWREMVLSYQRRAVSTRLGIPLLYGVDAVHGHSNVEGAVVFPHNIGLGATRNPDLVEAVYRATADATRATGIPWNFAPCVAVARDIRWGRTYESFSEDPDLVAELGAAAVRGLQGTDPGDDGRVVACAKHFIGDGATAYGTGAPKEELPDSVFEGSGGHEGTEDPVDRWPLDRGDARIDEATLRAVHLPGYLTTLEEGVATIMVSFSSWQGKKLSASRYWLTEVLKGELGFEGFLVSDWAAIDEIPGDYRSDVATSINAGMDMVMVPDKYREFFETLVSLVEAGEVPRARIDDAVRRILRVKYAAGLMDPEWSPETDPQLLGVIGSPDHRTLGRQAVRESLVLLKNEGVLPLAEDRQRIHVVGKNADDLGNQSGGWTIEWQGASGEINEGTTILEGIRAAVSPDVEVTYSLDGSGGEDADVVIAVVGETPYAEMLGDRSDLSLDEEDRRVLERTFTAGAPVVTVLVSGRPLLLGDALDRSSAVLAAWLPGTEGDGVADVLFGEYSPTGKLPFTWPRSMAQLPAPDEENPAFPLGFGLGY
ncbi:MAG: glycoside hydrolase family 3 N-terminal domain-containing protein [Thermoanaerobaculia bacterium]|nr:glycoside hydrolase family 3 N-terminal domain-containing protein [Thermoanaerobaculia bacterium]